MEDGGGGMMVAIGGDHIIDMVHGITIMEGCLSECIIATSTTENGTEMNGDGVMNESGNVVTGITTGIGMMIDNNSIRNLQNTEPAGPLKPFCNGSELLISIKRVLLSSNKFSPVFPFALCVLFVFLVLQGCGNNEDSIKKQLLKQGIKELDKYVIKCGDYWYTYPKMEDTLIEYKNRSITIDVDASKEVQVDEIQWKGYIYCKLTGERRYYSFHNWSDWEDQSLLKDTPTITIRAIKKRGEKIEVEPVQYFKEISCKDIPQ